MSDSTINDDRLFIGMDVHVRNSYLSVSDAAGQAVKRGRVGNTLGELAAFLGPLESRPMRVVLESTTNTRAICQMLGQYAKQSGATLSAQALDARKLRVIAESVSKCDKLDAVLHRRGVLVPVKMDLFTQAGRQWLKELTLDEAGRQILDRQLAVIDELGPV